MLCWWCFLIFVVPMIFVEFVLGALDYVLWHVVDDVFLISFHVADDVFLMMCFDSVFVVCFCLMSFNAVCNYVGWWLYSNGVLGCFWMMLLNRAVLNLFVKIVFDDAVGCVWCFLNKGVLVMLLSCCCFMMSLWMMFLDYVSLMIVVSWYL